MRGATIAGLTLGAGALAVAAGRRRFDALVEREVRSLFSTAIVAVGPEDLRARQETLPEPIRRYLHLAVREGAPAITTARLRHDGSFRTKPGQRWLPIEGEQYFTAAAPGFVWHARVRPAPLLWIEARDSLLSGRGNMLVKLESALPIARARGAEIDQGASLRWLAECAWFPYAFAGDAIRWDPLDGRSARASLRSEGLPASAVLEVDEEGRLVRLHAERYYDAGGGKAVLTPWTGRYAEYRDVDGFRVPTSVEVAWELEGGAFGYARFRVTTLEYNVARRFRVQHPDGP